MDIIVQDADVAASDISEGSAYTPSDASLRKITLTALKSGVLAYLTEELLDDWQLTPQGADLVVQNMAAVLARRQDHQIMTGIGGAGKRTGLASELKANNSGFHITSTLNTQNTITATQLQQAFDSLSPQYQANAIIVCRQSALKLLRAIATGVQGSHFWVNTFSQVARPAQSIQQVGWLFDKPVYVSNHIANNYTIGTVIDANKAAPIYIMDPRAAIGLGDRGQLKVSQSEHFHFDEDEVAYKARNRFDVQLQFKEAVSVLAYKELP